MYVINQETVIVHCDLDVVAFPYDTQTCSQTYQSVFFDQFMGFHFYATPGKFRTNRLGNIVGECCFKMKICFDLCRIRPA